MAFYYQRPKGQTCCQFGLAGPYSDITDIEYGNGLVCSTTSIRTNSVMTSEAAQIVCVATIVAASLDTAEQRRTGTLIRPITKLL